MGDRPMHIRFCYIVVVVVVLSSSIISSVVESWLWYLVWSNGCVMNIWNHYDWCAILSNERSKRKKKKKSFNTNKNVFSSSIFLSFGLPIWWKLLFFSFLLRKKKNFLKRYFSFIAHCSFLFQLIDQMQSFLQYCVSSCILCIYAPKQKSIVLRWCKFLCFCLSFFLQLLHWKTVAIVEKKK